MSAQADATDPFEAVRPYGPDNLDAAVVAIASGDETAFTTVYRLVHPRLLRYVRVLVGADAEDVASETWAQVCRDLHRFEGDGDDFRAWVATIGRHRAIDHLRALRRRPQDLVPIERLTGLPANSDTEAAAIEGLTTASAVALIGTLPTEQAEAVMLRAVLGLDAARAAAVLGKRSGAVRTATHRGLKTLGRRLTERAPQ